MTHFYGFQQPQIATILRWHGSVATGVCAQTAKSVSLKVSTAMGSTTVQTQATRNPLFARVGTLRV